MAFKVGDIVELLPADKQPNRDSSYSRLLSAGPRFKVKAIDGSFIDLISLSNPSIDLDGYYPSRFRLAPKHIYQRH